MDAVLGNVRSTFGSSVRKMFSNNTGVKSSPNSMEKSPSDLRVKKMSLCSVCEIEGNTVPFIVRDICEFIKTKSIALEGIFRVSASSRQINELRELYNSNTDYTNELLLKRTEYTEITGHAAAGLLKQFLRQLTDPLIPRDVLQLYTECKSVSDETFAEKVCSHMKTWLEPHRTTLLFLLPFLHMVARERENRMSVNGLAVVFGPNVFELPDGMEGLQAQGIANQAFERLLSCSALLSREFQNSPRPQTPPHHSPTDFRPLPQTPNSSTPRRAAPPTPTQSDTAPPVDKPFSPYIKNAPDDLMSFPKEESVFTKDGNIRADEEMHEETYDNVTLESSGEILVDLDVKPESKGKRTGILDSSIRQIVQTRLFNSTESSSVSDETDSKPSLTSSPPHTMTTAILPLATSSPTVPNASPSKTNLLPSATAGRVKGPKNRRKPSRPKPLLNKVHLDEDSEEETVVALTDSMATVVTVTTTSSPSSVKPPNSIKRTSTSVTSSTDVMPRSSTTPLMAPTALPPSVTTVVTPDSGCIIEDSEYPRSSSPIKAELASFEINDRISPVDTFIPKLNLRSSYDEEELAKVTSSPHPPNDEIVPQLDLSSVIDSDDLSRPKPLPRHHHAAERGDTEKLVSPDRPARTPPRTNGTPPHPIPRQTSAKPGTRKKKRTQSSNSKKSVLKSPESPEVKDSSAATETSREIMERCRDRILTVLRENRRVAGRPFDVTRMAQEELKDEKLSMQRELLRFEGKYGRPATKESKQVMREVYDRYRAVKRALAKWKSGEQGLDENENTIKFPADHELGDSFVITQKLPTENLTSCDESDVTIEGSDITTTGLLRQIHELRGKKKRLRRILRDFENERGSGVERRVMRSEYEQYKDIKNKLSKLEVALAKKGVQVQ